MEKTGTFRFDNICVQQPQRLVHCIATGTRTAFARIIPRPFRLIENDLLALEKRASKQLANGVANVGPCNNRHGPFLPLAVPAEQLAMFRGHEACP